MKKRVEEEVEWKAALKEKEEKKAIQLVRKEQQDKKPTP